MRSLLLLAHRNILFYLILGGARYLGQVPHCQAMNSNNSDLYFLLLSLSYEDSSHVAFLCSHRSYQSNKNEVFGFFLLPLKLNIVCLKILSDLSQFGNPLACCK